MAEPPDTPSPSDKPPTMPSAFLIPELLENIIMHLPLRDILLCQRVGTQFRDVVQDSSNIKKALFLEPATSNKVEFCFGIPSTFTDKRTKHVEKEYWKTSEKGEIVRPLLNPFLVSLFETDDRPWKWAALDAFAPANLNHGMRLSTRLDSRVALESSAKRLSPMLVTHPHSRSLAAWHWRNSIPTMHDIAEEDSRVGVRFDALFKAATARRSAPRCVEPAGVSQWRVFPESALDRVTGWDMLAVLNKTDPKDMREEIDRIIKALKKWDYVVDGNSEGEDEQKGAFAWELEDVEQDTLFETVTVGSGPW